MNFTPVHAGLMQYVSTPSDKRLRVQKSVNQQSESLIAERKKIFFDTLGNKWYCSLQDFNSYVQTGKPSNLSVFKVGTTECRKYHETKDPIQSVSETDCQMPQIERTKLENAHYDLLYKEYEDAHNYFSKYNDLSEAKELEYIVHEDSDEALTPRECDTLQQEEQL